MKPIQNIEKFLERFNRFKDGEIRSIEILSPTNMLITLAGQDNARAFDWVSIRLDCHGIVDARLLENTKLSLIDMNDGISIIKNDSYLVFGVGECYNISHIKNSTCYIECADIKYEEGLF